jgi:hypothetical protein
MSLYVSYYRPYSKHNTNIHAPGGIRTHNPSKRAAEDSRLRPHGHWDRLNHRTATHNFRRCVAKWSHTRKFVLKRSWSRMVGILTTERHKHFSMLLCCIGRVMYNTCLVYRRWTYLKCFIISWIIAFKDADLPQVSRHDALPSVQTADVPTGGKYSVVVAQVKCQVLGVKQSVANFSIWRHSQTHNKGKDDYS